MKNGKIGGQKSEPPEPLNIKFGMDDYLGDARIQNNRFSGGLPAHG